MKSYSSKSKKSKYGNKKTERDGIVFDSKKEANYYTILKYREKQGHVKDIKRQVRYPIYGRNGAKICDYIADFVYFDLEKKDEMIVDVKGYKTDVYRLKKKLLEDQYEIKLTEV